MPPRATAPAGLFEIGNRFIIADSGQPDEVAPCAELREIDRLRDDALIYLVGSRYCGTKKLSNLAWSLFAHISGGWQRVQTICDDVHDRIEFGYHHARCDRTAAEGHEERINVRRALRPSSYWASCDMRRMLRFRLRSDQLSSRDFRSSPKNQEEENTSSLVPASENSSA